MTSKQITCFHLRTMLFIASTFSMSATKRSFSLTKLNNTTRMSDANRNDPRAWVHNLWRNLRRCWRSYIKLDLYCNSKQGTQILTQGGETNCSGNIHLQWRQFGIKSRCRIAESCFNWTRMTKKPHRFNGRKMNTNSNLCVSLLSNIWFQV